MRSSRGRRWHRSSAIAAVTAAVIGLVGGLAVNTVDIKAAWWAPALWTATGLLILLAAIFEWARHRSSVEETTGDLQEAAATLAELVRVQWAEEASRRYIRRPVPLTVRWSSTGRPVAAGREAVLGTSHAPGWDVLPMAGDVNEIVAAFSGLPNRQLVVLGAPGAGKTALAMLLTLGLVESRQAADPVPVLLGIESWNPTSERLDAFVVRRLTEDNRFLTARDMNGQVLAERMVSGGRILAILDGLDELPTGWQAAALEAIEVYGSGRGVVLTCRAADYEAAIERRGSILSRAAVIEIQPIDAEQVVAYLARAPYATLRWSPVFEHLRKDPQGDLAAVLSTPLMVAFAQTAFGLPRSNPTVLLQLPDRSSIVREIVNRFVASVYEVDDASAGDAVTAGRQRYRPDRAARYLSCLAYHLYQTRSRDFSWWRLSMTMFSFRPWRRVWLDPALIAMITSVAAVLGFAVGGPWAAIRAGIAAAVVVGGNSVATFAAAWPMTYPAQPTAQYGSPRLRRGFRIFIRFAFGQVTGLLVGMVYAGSLLGVLGGAVCGLIFLVPTWVPRVPPLIASARLTLRVNRRTMAAVAVQAGLVGAVVFAGLTAILPTARPAVVAGAIAGGVFALNAALGAGLWTWVWFRLAHLLLAARGWLPWRLWTFLADAHERGTLRQAGTLLQFRHAVLQDHLAENVRVLHLRARANAGDIDALDRVISLFALRGRTDDLIFMLRPRTNAGDRLAASELADLEDAPPRQAQRPPAAVPASPHGIASPKTNTAGGGGGGQVLPIAAEEWLDELASVDDVDGRRSLAYDRAFSPEELSGLLAESDILDELRARATGGDRFALNWLIESLVARGETEKALAILRTHADTGDDRAEEQLVEVLAGAGRLDEAVAILESRADDGDPQADEMLVDLLVRYGRRAEAIAMLEARAAAGLPGAERKLAALLDGDVRNAYRLRSVNGPPPVQWQRPQALAKPLTVVTLILVLLLLIFGYVETPMLIGGAFPEAFSVPIALALLSAGAVATRRRPDIGSLYAYGPGLLVGLLPSLLMLLVRPDGLLRPVLLLTACAGLFLWGFYRRLRSHVIVAASVAAIAGARLLATLLPIALPLTLTMLSAALAWAILRQPRTLRARFPARL